MLVADAAEQAEMAELHNSATQVEPPLVADCASDANNVADFEPCGDSHLGPDAVHDLENPQNAEQDLFDEMLHDTALPPARHNDLEEQHNPEDLEELGGLEDPPDEMLNGNDMESAPEDVCENLDVTSSVHSEPLLGSHAVAYKLSLCSVSPLHSYAYSISLF